MMSKRLMLLSLIIVSILLASITGGSKGHIQKGYENTDLLVDKYVEKPFLNPELQLIEIRNDEGIIHNFIPKGVDKKNEDNLDNDIGGISTDMETQNRDNQNGRMIIVGPYQPNKRCTNGFITSDIGERLIFDLSLIYLMQPLIKIEHYELDFDGDGIYEVKSSNPKCEVTYEERGIYRVQLRVTGYYINYTPMDDNHGAPVYLANCPIQTLHSTEYEIKVSVGTKEHGYPIIPDFKINGFEYSNLDVYKRKVYQKDLAEQKNPELSFFNNSHPVFNPQIKTSGGHNESCIVVPIRTTENREKHIFIDPKVEFDASNSMNPNKDETEYYWDFGDGTSKKGKYVIHTYERKGEYVVTLFVDNKRYNISKTVRILRGNLDPKLIILTDDIYLHLANGYLKCHVNEPVTFDLAKLVDSDKELYYEWDFNNDGIYEFNLSSPMITYEFTEVGYYEIMLHIGSQNERLNYFHSSNFMIKCLVGSANSGHPPLPDFTINPRFLNPPQPDFTFNSRPDLPETQNQQTDNFQDNVQIPFTTSPGLNLSNDQNQRTGVITNITSNPDIIETKTPQIFFLNDQNQRTGFITNITSNPDIIETKTPQIFFLNDQNQRTEEFQVDIRVQSDVQTVPAPTFTVWDKRVDFDEYMRIVDHYWEVDEEVVERLRENCIFVQPQRINRDSLSVYPMNVQFSSRIVIDLEYRESHYFWDFGDGNYSHGTTTTHVYENPGIYNVTLWVNEGHFNVSKTSTINVSEFVRSIIPNIYLYPDEPTYDDVILRFKGHATVTVPEVKLGSEIRWESIWTDGEKITYEGQSYDFLFYECDIIPVASNLGWILERDESGILYLDGHPLTYEELKMFFRKELGKAGLFENEIDDFIYECFGDDAMIFFGLETFKFAIRYIPSEVLNEVMSLETKVHYDNVIRVHFLIESADGGETLTPPIYPQSNESGSSIHEWGIIKGAVF